MKRVFLYDKWSLGRLITVTMRDELYNNLGFYNSAFLKMHVRTLEDLGDLSKISIHTEATFFHEYIHYLQDITTTYGLMNISNIVDYIKYSNKSILADDENDFKVPIIPVTSNNHDVKANWELKKIYLGAGVGMNDIARVRSVYKKSLSVTTNNGIISPETLILKFDDSLGRNYEYIVGAYCISESMAYTMEQYIYPNVLIQPNKLPYESIKIVCDELLPGFSSDPLNIIALCDASMQSFNPGQILYDTLISFAQNGLPKFPEDVYHHVFALSIFNY